MDTWEDEDVSDDFFSFPLERVDSPLGLEAPPSFEEPSPNPLVQFLPRREIKERASSSGSSCSSTVSSPISQGAGEWNLIFGPR